MWTHQDDGGLERVWLTAIGVLPAQRSSIGRQGAPKQHESPRAAPLPSAPIPIRRRAAGDGARPSL